MVWGEMPQGKPVQSNGGLCLMFALAELGTIAGLLFGLVKLARRAVKR